MIPHFTLDMMVKPIIIGFTDLHMVSSNIDELLSLVEEGCDLSDKIGVDLFFISGDLFDSRVSQRLDVLNGMQELFDILERRGKHALIIPGNHDKTNYKSKDSFLDSFRHHPAITLFDEYGAIDLDGILLHMFPFFEYGCGLFNENFEIMLANIEQGVKNVMIGHMAVEGSVNNDGSVVSGVLNRSQLKDFDLVALGHYHDTHTVGKNILHISSIRQKNFGENDNKGFTILFDDLSTEMFQPNFTKYKVYSFNLNTDTVGDIIDVANEIHGNGNMNRFELCGDRERVKGFDASRFKDMGIDVKKKYSDLEDTLDRERDVKVQLEVNTWTENKIRDKFDEFCEKNKLDKKDGLGLLTEIISESNE